jgi:hypothetical protein
VWVPEYLRVIADWASRHFAQSSKAIPPHALDKFPHRAIGSIWVLTIDGEQLEIDLKTWAIARADSLSDRAYIAMASITADDVLKVLVRGSE